MKRMRWLLFSVAAVGLFMAGRRIGNMRQIVGCRSGDLAQITDTSFIKQETTVNAGGTQKRVCLTFDDGPSKNTEKVLEILAEEDVPATFFVIAAENNKEYLPLVQKEVEMGEQIGYHTACHEYEKIYSSPEAFWDDIDALRAALALYMDTSQIDCLRFPGGSTNTVSHRYGGGEIMKDLKAQAQEKGYYIVDWNVCADDAVGGHPSASKVYHNTIEDVDGKDTCVVLMHDTAATGSTVEALPDIIAWFKDNGYTFCTVNVLYDKKW